MDLKTIAVRTLSLDWDHREEYWWTALRSIGADPEALAAVNRQGRELDPLPLWAAVIRQQIRDFSPCHYCFPFALEVLLEGVGNEAPKASFRGCRSVSEARRLEAGRQAAILQGWLKEDGRFAADEVIEDPEQEFNPRETLSLLGKKSREKERRVRRLLAVLNRERGKDGMSGRWKADGVLIEEPVRDPELCDRSGGESLPEDNGPAPMEGNPICHFKYFPFINFHLASIGTEKRKTDLISRRQIERDYRNRVQQIREYAAAMECWLAATSLRRALKSCMASRELVRRVYALLDPATPAKQWLVATIRTVLSEYERYYTSRVIPLWGMSASSGGEGEGAG